MVSSAAVEVLALQRKQDGRLTAIGLSSRRILVKLQRCKRCQVVVVVGILLQSVGAMMRVSSDFKMQEHPIVTMHGMDVLVDTGFVFVHLHVICRLVKLCKTYVDTFSFR
jgi:hypothetical protein